MPRWVKLTGVIAAVLVILLLAVLIFGGGEHGPGSHSGSPGDRNHRAGHTPPEGSDNDGGGRNGPEDASRALAWTVDAHSGGVAPDDAEIPVDKSAYYARHRNNQPATIQEHDQNDHTPEGSRH